MTLMTPPEKGRILLTEEQYYAIMTASDYLDLAIRKDWRPSPEGRAKVRALIADLRSILDMVGQANV